MIPILLSVQISTRIYVLIITLSLEVTLGPEWWRLQIGLQSPARLQLHRGKADRGLRRKFKISQQLRNLTNLTALIWERLLFETRNIFSSIIYQNFAHLVRVVPAQDALKTATLMTRYMPRTGNISICCKFIFISLKL